MELVLKEGKMRYRSALWNDHKTKILHVYIKNNGNSRPIRGVFTNKAMRPDVIGPRKFTRNFVVLPNKSIYLGSWDINYKYDLSEVSFLTEEETEALGKMKNSE